MNKLSRMAAVQAKIYSDFVARGPGRTKEIAAIITDPVQRQKRYDVLAVLQRLHDVEMLCLTEHQTMAQEQQRYASILTLVIVALAFLGGLLDLMARVYGSRTRRKSDISFAE
jgi:hypothetical protein